MCIKEIIMNSLSLLLKLWGIMKATSLQIRNLKNDSTKLKTSPSITQYNGSPSFTSIRRQQHQTQVISNSSSTKVTTPSSYKNKLSTTEINKTELATKKSYSKGVHWSKPNSTTPTNISSHSLRPPDITHFSRRFLEPDLKGRVKPSGLTIKSKSTQALNEIDMDEYDLTSTISRSNGSDISTSTRGNNSQKRRGFIGTHSSTFDTLATEDHTKNTIKAELEHAKSKLLLQNHEIESLQESISSLKSELKLLNDENKQLQQENGIEENAGMCQLALKEREIESWRNQCEEYKTTINNINSTLISERLEMELFKNDLLLVVRSANDLKTEAESKCVKLQTENCLLHRKISTLENDLWIAKEEINQSKLVYYNNLNETALGLSRKKNNFTSEVIDHDNSQITETNSEINDETTNISRKFKSSIQDHYNIDQKNENVNSFQIDLDYSNKENISARKENFKLQTSTFNDNNQVQISNNHSINDGLPLPTSFRSFLSSSNSDSTKNPTSKNNSINKMNLEEREVSNSDPLQDLIKITGSKRNALLAWCQTRTKGYKSVDITNFSSSWYDGMALNALLASFLPDKIPYEKLTPENRVENFELAFKVAESIGITSSWNPLNSNDNIETPAWLQVMDYVKEIYTHLEKASN